MEEIAVKIQAEAKIASGVLLPGVEGDHAMLYQFEQSADGTYSFSILNTGKSSTYQIHLDLLNYKIA